MLRNVSGKGLIILHLFFLAERGFRAMQRLPGWTFRLLLLCWRVISLSPLDSFNLPPFELLQPLISPFFHRLASLVHPYFHDYSLLLYLCFFLFFGLLFSILIYFIPLLWLLLKLLVELILVLG
jgi:hypothetical protein